MILGVSVTFGTVMMKLDLQKELTEQLNIEEVFSFNIGNVRIGFDESTVVSWIIIAVLTVLAIILTANLKVTGKISKRQALLEMCYEKAESFFIGIIGEKGKPYTQWLMSMALFIGVSNIIGLFGFKPPTKSLQVTAAMAVTSMVVVVCAAIREKGVGGWIKSFTEPIWIITPINLLEMVTKPLSLCLRLFGNVIGAFTIMELIKAVVPIVVPVALSLYFDIFDGLLQAYIFVFLTSLYIQEAVETDEEAQRKKSVKKLKKSKAKKISA